MTWKAAAADLVSMLSGNVEHSAGARALRQQLTRCRETAHHERVVADVGLY